MTMTCQTYFLRKRQLSNFFTLYCLFFLHFLPLSILKHFISSLLNQKMAHRHSIIFLFYCKYHLLTIYLTVCHFCFLKKGASLYALQWRTSKTSLMKKLFSTWEKLTTFSTHALTTDINTTYRHWQHFYSRQQKHW